MRPDIAWILKNRILFREQYRFSAEPQVYRLIKNMKGNTFVDVGCNQGLYSRLAEKRFRNVVSVDPNPRYKADFELAISNYNGIGKFYLYNGIGSADSLIQDPHVLGKDYHQEKSFDVTVRTFDSLIESLREDLRKPPDFVKIDTEGSEFEVIEGIKDYPPKNAVIELHDERREQELKNKMMAKGYFWHRIDGSHWLFQLPI